MKAIGNQTLSVPYGSIVTLTPPEGAKFAVIVCEPDSSSAQFAKAVRYWIDGSNPTPTQGLHLGSLRHTLTLGGPYALSQIKFTGVEVDKLHILQIQYWK